MSVDLCDARQGGGAYGKNASNAAFLRFLAFCWPFAHMFFPALSPDSVDNRITAFE
ncbi:hypothetical protein EC24168_1692 [Escherichia coli 2.4168]|nr:hypothetical protein EC24168_1692 [Escherichia coli 2.4168]